MNYLRAITVGANNCTNCPLNTVTYTRIDGEVIRECYCNITKEDVTDAYFSEVFDESCPMEKVREYEKASDN
jgi:hypothetical protein